MEEIRKFEDFRRYTMTSVHHDFTQHDVELPRIPVGDARSLDVDVAPPDGVRALHVKSLPEFIYSLIRSGRSIFRESMIRNEKTLLDEGK